MSDIVLHVPHASPVIPPRERSAMLPDDRELARELLRMTDAHTHLLVSGFAPEAARVVFPVSRLVVDVERFPDDAGEAMAARGMGAVYTSLSTGAALRRVDAAERERLMRDWYAPHHRRLGEAVDEALGRHGRCLIVDVHSFASVPLPHEPDQSPDRPEICIGVEPFHSPFRTEERVLRTCRELGFSAAVNRPFAGSLVPAGHWERTREVRSFMIEVRRDLYMSEASGERVPDFDAVRARVVGLLDALVRIAD